MIELLFLRKLIVLVAVGIAAYTDWKEGLIYDKLTYPLIGIGVLLNLLEFNLEGFFYGGIVFVIGYALYWLGKIGGGDVKLFLGITLVLPVLAQYPFILAAMFFAAVISVVFFGVFYVGKYLRKGIDWKLNREGICRALLFGVFFALYLWIINSFGIFSFSFLGVIAVPVVFALVFLAFEKGIKKEFFLRKVSVGKLEEDDVIATDFLDEKLKEKLRMGFKGIIDGKTKEKLQNLKIKHILVYRELPKFAPFVFAACLLLITKPEIVWILVRG